MNPSSPELKSELEAFRERWLSEVKSKRPAGPSHGKTPSTSGMGPSNARTASASAVPTSPPPAKAHLAAEGPSKSAALQGDDDHIQPPAFDEILEMAATKKGKEAEKEETGELVSALDHFEAAVVREAQGNLGDSLNLYRRAFRMDSGVDQVYRKKHFPSAPKPPVSHPAPAPAPTPASKPETPTSSQSIPDLISTFQNLSIVPTPPEVEGDPAPPCPIASVPDELLAHIFADLAVQDVADFARLSQVCKRFAYLVATEQRIWRRVCLGPEFGFGGMHNRFRTTINWDPLPDDPPVAGEPLPLTEEQKRVIDEEEKLAVTLSLHPNPYPTWKHMFRHRPRIRFNGCYISTVNYTRAGHSNANHITWNSPVHIVTYYRYLRFFRDGSAVSLLTVTEPAEVVPHLTRERTREAVEQQQGNGNPNISSYVVRGVLPGRWRLGEGGEVVVETEGAAARYIYRMDLALRSAGKAARNNKLVWSGFYSYNKLTDDWGTFWLKNDRPFFFSRVRSYGVGE